jgi:hypothetical protein
MMSDKLNTNLLLTYSQKPLFTIKKPITAKSYPELEIFKHQIEIERKSPHLPYTRVKKKVLTYKGIFLAFCMIFFFLTLLIFMKAVFWPFAHFTYSQFFIAKNLACALCALVGIFSLWIARTMRAETEAAKSVLRHARYRLNKAYARKKIEAGIKGIWAFGLKYQKSQVIKHSYHETYDKMDHHYEDLLHLFERIAQSSSLNAANREHLYNQAILEFSDKLKNVAMRFAT